MELIFLIETKHLQTSAWDKRIIEPHSKTQDVTAVRIVCVFGTRAMAQRAVRLLCKQEVVFASLAPVIQS